jgi:hypothetical protein
LADEAGPHFWLVVAPPQLGKSWFLDRVGVELGQHGSDPWTIRLVDLRAESPELRQDAGALLARLLDLPSMASEPEGLLAIAQAIARSGRPRLCMLDSAELLEPHVAARLRSEMSQIHRIVWEAGRKGVRLALIVSSRQTKGWLGVTPAPRLATLPLTEFGVEVVDQALRDLAQETGRSFSTGELRRSAALVHRVTEGLPAPLKHCLDWIEDQQWLAIDRLASQESFDEFAGPYIQDTLFAQRNLLPEARRPADDALSVLQQAFRVLAPHRLFTLSHLRYYLDRDPGLHADVTNLHWSIADLWQAVSDTSLVMRPLAEPWQVIQPAIRKLLFRFYYQSDIERAAAHSEALSFVGSWTSGQVGTDQVVGLVEGLWHEAIVVSIRHPEEMEQRLSIAAGLLARALRGTAAFTIEELQAYAADRITDDQELQETLGNVSGLLDKIVEIVARPLS